MVESSLHLRWISDGYEWVRLYMISISPFFALLQGIVGGLFLEINLDLASSQLAVAGSNSIYAFLQEVLFIFLNGHLVEGRAVQSDASAHSNYIAREQQFVKD